MKRVLPVLALLLFPACASAQEMQMDHAPANCPADAKPLPAALAGWKNRSDLAAAGDAAGLDAAALTPGKAVTVTLRHEVQYVAKPQKPVTASTYGGLLMLAVKQSGTYQVSLGAGAWIDMLKDGAEVASNAHSPGPACSGIRKMVQFPLSAGRYVIQLSGNGDPAIAILVSRVP